MLLPTDFGLGPKEGPAVGGCGEGRTGQTRLPACCFLQGPPERGRVGAGSCSTAVVPWGPAAMLSSHCTVLQTTSLVLQRSAAASPNQLGKVGLCFCLRAKARARRALQKSLVPYVPVPPRWDLFCASLKSTKRSAGKGWWTPRVVLGCRKWGRAAQTHTGVVLRQLVPETVVLLRLALSIGLPQPLYHLKMSPRLSRSISAVILAFHPIRRRRPSAGTQHRNAPHAGARSPILPLGLSSSPHPSHPPPSKLVFRVIFSRSSISAGWSLPEPLLGSAALP